MKSEKDAFHEPATAEFKHVPALDGMRGVAVIMVIAFHGAFAVPSLAPLTGMGFTGVDVFFVLSGFLITAILLKERAKNDSINLKNFYARRFLRLVPAYWTFLIFVYFLGSSYLDAEQSAILYGDRNFIAAFLYLWNWQHIAIHPDVPPSLIHLWSLAIEEQFYIGFSALMWLFVRFKVSKSRMLWTVGGLVFLLIIARAVRLASGTALPTIIASTDTRIDGILIGALAGMVYMWRILPDRFYESRVFKLLAALSFLLLAGVYFLASKDALYYGALMPAFSVAVAVLVLYLTAAKRNYAHRLLEFAPLQFTGRISYGLYMWNTVAFIIGTNVFGAGMGIFLFGAALSYGFAVISYYKIEEPFLKLKSKFA